MDGEAVTKSEVAGLAGHIPIDYGARSVVGVTNEEWFIVGPNCLELWWQFKGPRYYKFIDPYVGKILSEVEK